MSSHCQSLEPRRLFAGVVRVDTSGGVTRIMGDRLSNAVRIEMQTTPDGDASAPLIRTLGSTRLVVDGVGIDAQAYVISPSVPASVKSIRVDLKEGDDILALLGPLTGSLPAVDINAGLGNDGVSVQYAVDALAFRGGRGDDVLAVAPGVVINGDLDVAPGEGADRVTIGAKRSADDVVVRGRLRVQDFYGSLSFSARRLRVKRETYLAGSENDDYLGLLGCTFSRLLTLDARTGDDAIDGTGSAFRGGTDVRQSPNANDTVVGLADDRVV